VLDKDRSCFRHGSPADTAADRDTHASGLALERSEDKLVPRLQHVEAGPVEVWQRLKDEGGGVGGIGNAILLAGKQSGQLGCKLAIKFRLAVLPDGLFFKHRLTSCSALAPLLSHQAHSETSQNPATGTEHNTTTGYIP